MRRKHSMWGLAVVVLVGLWAWSQQTDNGTLHTPVAAPASTGAPATQSPIATDAFSRGYPSFLPPEAHPVLAAIAAGGPYDYRQDGGVFQNREGLLPRQPRGYYREFTVETPGSDDRGARRIVSGGEPPVEYFYTDDHYRSFRRFTLGGGGR